MSERGQEELGELANKYNAAVNEIKELTDKIKVRAQALRKCVAVLRGGADVEDDVLCQLFH